MRIDIRCLHLGHVADGRADVLICRCDERQRVRELDPEGCLARVVARNGR